MNDQLEIFHNDYNKSHQYRDQNRSECESQEEDEKKVQIWKYVNVKLVYISFEIVIKSFFFRIDFQWIWFQKKVLNVWQIARASCNLLYQ